MKYLLEVCLIAITLTLSGMPPVAAQSVSSDALPTLRKGISVELPRTTSAVSVPEADKEDALVVTIKRDGSAYLGTNPIGIAELAEKSKDALSTRAEKNVYLKADAHSAYASVIGVLDFLHSAGIEGVTLLTVQSEEPAPGTLTPPKGLVMRIVSTRTVERSSNLY